LPDRLLNADPTAVVAPPTHSNKQIEVVTTLLKIEAAILVFTSTLKKLSTKFPFLYPAALRWISQQSAIPVFDLLKWHFY
jgi:hypothetical protein